MKALRAMPYRRLGPNMVDVGRWGWLLPSGTSLLPPVMASWDPQTLLQLLRTVRISPDIRTSVGIPEWAPLYLAVTWHASGSGLRGLAQSWDIPQGEGYEGEIEVELNGEELGGTLTVKTRVILGAGLEPIAVRPHIAGSILWEDEVSTRLEGPDPSFPVTLVDFDHTGFDRRAEWHLEIGEDPAMAALGSLRLYINTRFQVVRDAFAQANSPDPTQLAILRSVMSDVRRLMLERAMIVDRQVAWEEGSLGRLLLHRLDVDLAGRNADAVEELRREYPNEFDTLIRAETGPVFSTKE